MYIFLTTKNENISDKFVLENIYFDIPQVVKLELLEKVDLGKVRC